MVNPAGILYRIRCFASAPGCTEAGEFTTEYTWFAGFAWRYALCASCWEHVGWVYRRSAEASDGLGAFFGLIADKLVERPAA